jgi:hypothetical protein
MPLTDDSKKKLQGRALKPPVIDTEALEAEVLEGLPEHSCAAWHRLCEEDDNAAVWFGEQAELKEAAVVQLIQSELLDVLHRTARMEAGLPAIPPAKEPSSFTRHEQALGKAMQAKLAKYEKLIWYARRPSRDDEVGWANQLPNQEIRDKALNEMARVEEMFPGDVNRLKSPSQGDWQHGFNSGMVAALRWVIEAGAESIESAEANFPELDT